MPIPDPPAKMLGVEEVFMGRVMMRWLAESATYRVSSSVILMPRFVLRKGSVDPVVPVGEPSTLVAFENQQVELKRLTVAKKAKNQLQKFQPIKHKKR